MSVVNESFAALRGELCWKVLWDRQLGLELSFGAPTMSVREPYESESRSERVKRMAASRLVTVRGTWWLYAHCGKWTLTMPGHPVVTHRSAANPREMALAHLDGQKLTGWLISPASGRTQFHFDLDTLLAFDGSRCSDGEMWSLYKPSGYVLSVRADGQFSHERGTKPDRWRPLSSRTT